jgi:hypothetical protein
MGANGNRGRWRWHEGSVSRRKAHFELRHGSIDNGGWDQWLPVALVGPPAHGVFPVQILLSRTKRAHAEALGDAVRELDFYLVAKDEKDPWAYAQYHCNTAANAYSTVHWSFNPGSMLNGSRTLATCRRFLQLCRSRLNREACEDLAWYEYDRPKRVTARALFESYAWALLVSGISRRSARTWASRTKFWDIFTVENCRRYSATALTRKVGISSRNKFGRKLRALHGLGRSVAGLSPKRVAARYFGGETRTSRLGELHARLLKDQLPLVQMPSARFIIRNLGGELIKDDRWLEAIRRHFGCSFSDLEAAGRSLRWKRGKVDLVVWCYCEQEVKSTRQLRRHLQALKL